LNQCPFRVNLVILDERHDFRSTLYNGPENKIKKYGIENSPGYTKVFGKKS
jgi:hypothetical protein